MKKARIVLTAIAVLTVVGGALAFKAKKGGVDLCTSTTSTGGCALKAQNQSAVFTSTTKFFYTVVPNGVPCPTDCPNPGEDTIIF